MEYICNVTCWVSWKKAMYNVGDIVDFADGEAVPGHFSLLNPPIIEEVKEEIVEPIEIEKEDIFVDTYKDFPKEELKPKRKPNFSKE
jgi:hypothetical protein